MIRIIVTIIIVTKTIIIITIMIITVVNTVAASHVVSAALKAGSPSEVTEEKKQKKYETLSRHYNFTPVAVGTLGPWGTEAISFVREIGKRLSTASGDPITTAFLRQMISLWSNAACMKHSLPNGKEFEKIFYS